MTGEGRGYEAPRVPDGRLPKPPAGPAPGGEPADCAEERQTWWRMGYAAAQANSEEFARVFGRAEQIDRLRALLDEILSQFTEPGHPGAPCHRTGWVRDDHLAAWRAAARQHGEERTDAH